MRIYPAGFLADVVKKRLRASRFVSTVPTVIVAAWLFAGVASVAPGCPPTARPYSDLTQEARIVVIAHPIQLAATEEEDDGDDQDSPDDPNDTLAAADSRPGAADVSLRTS